LNFIVTLFVSMLLDGPLKDPASFGWPASAPVLDELRLEPLVAGTRLHRGFLIGLAAAVVVWIMDTRTIWGFEIKAVGDNANAARFVGIPVERTRLRVASLSAALAATAGAIEVLGPKGDLTADLSPGFGYSGIVVATLAALKPLAVVPASIFVAGIFVGADAMSREMGLSNYVAEVMTALSLLTVLLTTQLLKYRVRL
jgi:simple sugar transport system permease protein